MPYVCVTFSQKLSYNQVTLECMSSKSKILGSLASLVFLLNIVSGVQAAQTTAKPSLQTPQFRRIEQHVGVKSWCHTG